MNYYCIQRMVQATYKRRLMCFQLKSSMDNVAVCKQLAIDFQNAMFYYAAAAAIFYWLNACDWIVGALMSYCCELNSLNRNVNARRDKKLRQQWHDMTHSLTTICRYACFMHERCSRDRPNPVRAYIRLVGHTIWIKCKCKWRAACAEHTCFE